MPVLPLLIAADHPAFAGHFPGRPIGPGVLLLDRALLAIESDTGLRLSGIRVAKFYSPVGPGEALQLVYAIDSGLAGFEIRCADRKVADGRFLIRQAATGA